MRDFFDDIKLLVSLHECSAVVKFAGVVIDDTRKHLLSCLCEWPVLGSFERLLTVVELRGEWIPWEIRETWARQIVAAVSDVHAKGVVLGVLSLRTILVRADGSAVLDAPKRHARILNELGCLPPELRSTNGSPSYKRMNFRTDNFRLGAVLWLLAEHKAFMSASNICSRYACTRWPRYSCEEHYNPIDLPPCRGPKYMDFIISHCRQNDPRRRLPAWELLRYLPENSPPAQIADLATKYPEKEGDHF